MLREIKHIRQISGEPFRRWFSNDIFDLIVWYSSDDEVIGFQLCYRFGSEEKALTWLQKAGFSHSRVDDGERHPGLQKMAPILVPDGTFESQHVLALFEKESKEIDPEVVKVVVHVIGSYPHSKRKD